MDKHIQKQIYLNDYFFPSCKYGFLFDQFPSEIVEHIISFLPHGDDDNCKQHFINSMLKDEDYDDNENEYDDMYFEDDFGAEFPETDNSDDDYYYY